MKIEPTYRGSGGVQGYMLATSKDLMDSPYVLLIAMGILGVSSLDFPRLED